MKQVDPRFLNLAHKKSKGPARKMQSSLSLKQQKPSLGKEVPTHTSPCNVIEKKASLGQRLFLIHAGIVTALHLVPTTRHLYTQGNFQAQNTQGPLKELISQWGN